jgi:hypothetical protein
VCRSGSGRGGARRGFPTHCQPLLIDTSQHHGIVERGRVLELHVCAQGITEASREDVDLMLLHQVVATCKQSQELALVFRHCGLSA